MKRNFIRARNLLLNGCAVGFIAFLFLFAETLRKGKGNASGMRKITWFGAYGNGNLGDDLIFYSLKRILNHLNLDITLSIRDMAKAKVYGVELFKKGEQLFDFWRYAGQIRKSDAVFLGGGGLFEYYYPSKQAYRMILVYLFPLMIARIFGKPIFVLGVGVNSDQIRNPIFRILYKRTLSACNLIITRDAKSKLGLEHNGVNTEIINAFDPVLGLNLYALRRMHGLRKRRKIGLLLWPYFLWPHFYENAEIISEEKSGLHKEFKRKIDRLLGLLKPIYDVEFLTFHFSDTLLYNELSQPHPQEAELMTFLRNAADCDLLISMRYHGIITGFLFHLPVVSLSVQQKMDAVMENYQMTNFNHAIENFDPDTVFSQVLESLEQSQTIGDHIGAINAEVRSQIAKAYGKVTNT